jgi:hypothetical protein
VAALSLALWPARPREPARPDEHGRRAPCEAPDAVVDVPGHRLPADVCNAPQKVVEGPRGAAGTRGLPVVDRHAGTLGLLDRGAFRDRLRHCVAKRLVQLGQAVLMLRKPQSGTVRNDRDHAQSTVSLAPGHLYRFDGRRRSLHSEIGRFGDHNRLRRGEQGVASQFPQGWRAVQQDHVVAIGSPVQRPLQSAHRIGTRGHGAMLQRPLSRDGID